MINSLLTRSFLVTTPSREILPTIVDNAFSLGLLVSKMVGISFEPTTSLGAINGELRFGGVDPTFFTGQINFV